MRLRLGLAVGLLLCPALGAQPGHAQTFGPSLTLSTPQTRQPGLMPLYQPQRLPATTTPAKPGADVAYGAYQRGYYVTAFQEAMKRLDKNKSDAAAMTLVAEIYRDGSGVKKDSVEAARWYKLAADLGNPQAQFQLAAAALKGEGVPEDRKLAKSMLEKAAAQGHAGAFYNLGIMAIDADIQDFKAAAAYFRKAAEGGNMDGAYSLAVLYREGRGVPQDIKEAARWLRMAADDHIAAAEVELGIMTFNGEGVPKDEAAAAKLFLRAAVRNNPVAMNRLARLYASGRGVSKNPVEAVKWHLLARAVGLQDEFLDGVLNNLSATERAEVEAAVKKFVSQ
jgi:TPR repeat protein